MNEALENLGLGKLKSYINADNDYQYHRIVTDQRDDALDGAMLTMQNKLMASPSVKLWVIILPDEKSSLYNRVKQTTDVKLGIPIVCQKKQAWFDKDPKLQSKIRMVQTFSNICMKVNLKLGEETVNHKLTKLSGILAEDHTMVVGIDVVSDTNLARTHRGR